MGNRTRIVLGCWAAVGIGLALMGAARAQQQQQPAPQAVSDPDDAGQASVVLTAPPPVTKVETLLAKRGVVVIRGYTDVGAAAAEDDAAVRILAVEAKTPDGQRESGLAIEVRHGDHDVVAYLDADEVPAVVAAMGDLARLNNTSSALAEFDARYHGRGGFELLNRNVNGARMVAIRSTQVVSNTGSVTWATAYFRSASLGQLQDAMAKGIEILQRADK